MADDQAIDDLRQRPKAQEALVAGIQQTAKDQNDRLTLQFNTAQKRANELQQQAQRQRIRKVYPSTYFGNPGDDFHKWIEEEFALKTFSNG